MLFFTITMNMMILKKGSVIMFIFIDCWMKERENSLESFTPFTYNEHNKEEYTWN